MCSRLAPGQPEIQPSKDPDSLDLPWQWHTEAIGEEHSVQHPSTVLHVAIPISLTALSSCSTMFGAAGSLGNGVDPRPVPCLGVELTFILTLHSRKTFLSSLSFPSP